MFFTEAEKKLYDAPDGRKFDPLYIDRSLTILSGNRLNEYITLRNAPGDNLGDVSKEGRQAAAVEAAKAEIELGKLALRVFEFPPETPLAVALETLYHFMVWLEGKVEPAGKPQSSPESSPEASELTVTTPSSPST